MGNGIFNALLGGLFNPQGGAPHGADPNNLHEGMMMGPMFEQGWGFDEDGNPVPGWVPDDPNSRRARAARKRYERAMKDRFVTPVGPRWPNLQGQFGGLNPWGIAMGGLGRHHDAVVRTGDVIGQDLVRASLYEQANKDRNLELMKMQIWADVMKGAQNAMTTGLDNFGDWMGDFNAKIEGEGIPGLTATNPEGPQAVEEEDGVDKFSQAVEPKKVLPEMEWMAGMEGSGDEVTRDLLGRAQTEAGAEVFHPAWDEGADQHIEQQKMAATGVHGQMDATNEERARHAQNRMDEVNRAAGEQMANIDYNVSKQGIKNQAQMAAARNRWNLINQSLPMFMQGMPG